MEVNATARESLVHHAHMHHRKSLALDRAELLLQLGAAIIEPGLLCTHAAVIDVCSAAGEELRR